jgi:hypothetical protein
MKHWNRVFIFAVPVAVVTFGLSWIAFSIDPWTGESDGNTDTEYITVPLVLLSLPFAVGLIGAGMVMDHGGSNLAGYIAGGVCQYVFYWVITALVMQTVQRKGARSEGVSHGEQ